MAQLQPGGYLKKQTAQIANMKNTKENTTLKVSQARELRAELARNIAFFIGKEENRITEIPGVSLHRRTSPSPPCRMTYHPGVVVVAQGSKQVNLGPTSFIYDESHFLVTAIDLPIVSWVAEATEKVPCLVLSLKLDMSMVRELLGREEIHVAEAPSDSPAMSIGETTPEFLNACCRLLDLLDSPEDIPFLSGLIQREITYRILRGPEGARLRAVATLGDQSHRTAKAVAWITANYAKPLHVEELAQIASMGVSTLHHHFRMLTAMSPLQYQKQLRLQSARSLMLNKGLDAASAAFEVGYESPTQFNREYSRFFGQPPMRDIRALLSPDVPKLELVGSL
ncbi:MAG TPA: AraC family transcriptional regulator [Verrucomicrobiae bacterium]|nr:AraC family transcriptional regulator [Verrucomicrobiae bacterium]